MLITAMLPPGSSLEVTLIATADDGAVIIVLTATKPAVPCPVCDTRATHIHSRYQRTVADLPWQGHAVRLRLCTRRSYCTETSCPQRIFGERFPGLVAPHGRRTARLTTLVEALGMALGGEAGARLAADLGLRASPDTLLRVVRAIPFPVPLKPRVLGVDDWARRRGHTYGTVLVDLERHVVVDLLPDRTADTLAGWLRAHPEVEIISRDRASAYADGARQGAPAAIQVADRWHLLKNVGDALEDFLRGQSAVLRSSAHDEANRRAEALTDPAAASMGTIVAAAAPLPLPPWLTGGSTRLQARYADVCDLHGQGLTIQAISRQTGFARATIRNYLRATSCPARASPVGLFSPGSPWEARLRERWAAGCSNAALLWSELHAAGFPGSAGSVRRHVGRWRPMPGRRGGPPQQMVDVGLVAPTAPRPPSPRQVRGWLLRSAEARTPTQAGYLDRLSACCPAVALAGQVVREFGRLVRERDALAFDAWLATAEASGIVELREVAVGMRRDYAAIAAAVRLPWSNGQTEGQVTRLKLVKRMMYGRGKLDLLRRRVMRVA